VHATDNSTGTGICIGTPGWPYDHWKGPFYPEDLPSDQRLTYYSRHFSTVEINNSFDRSSAVRL
jgi:uncharacterized protein YecE (DUF72 family)